MDGLLQTARELNEHGCLNPAVVLLRQVIELDLDNAQAYLVLGLAFYAQADYVRAVKALRVACGLRRDQGMTYFHLARALQAVGDVQLMRSVRFTLARVVPDWYEKLDAERPPPLPGD
jgi:uncharacterized protein HemY